MEIHVVEAHDGTIALVLNPRRTDVDIEGRPARLLGIFRSDPEKALRFAIEERTHQHLRNPHAENPHVGIPTDTATGLANAAGRCRGVLP